MKNKKIILITTAIILGLIILIGFICMSKSNATREIQSDTIESAEKINANIYYLNNLGNELVFETRELEQIEDEAIYQLFEFMKEQPKTLNGAVSVVPQDLDILYLDIDNDKTLKVDFSKEYNNMIETEEIFFRSAFVWTMTELNTIENVEVSIEGEVITKSNGEPLGLLNRENIVLNPVIAAEEIELQEVTLYFSDDQEMHLVPEIRLIEIKQSKDLEMQIVEELILGPEEEGHFATIPEETKIRNIKTEGGICYVDFSNEFITKHSGGSTAELFTIYSIVNSLTELEEVNKVQFLIEGEKVSIYKSSLDISKPLDKSEI